VTGYTSSPDLPTTSGALQQIFAGGTDAFVKKLNPTGSDLVYSTFLGGTGGDFGNAIAVDSLGQAYVAGATYSSDFPLVRAVQSMRHGGPLFRSTDSGANWQDIPGLYSFIDSLVVDPEMSSTLYASSSGGIIRSTDAGTTWRAIAPLVRGRLVIDPMRPAILYALGSGLYKSTDAGFNWQPSGPSTFQGFSVLVVDPKMPDTLYLGTEPIAVPAALWFKGLDSLNGPIFKTTDGGTNWTALNFGSAVSVVPFVAIDPQMTSTVYAETNTLGLMKTTDGGIRWFRPTAGPQHFSRLVVDPKNPATLYGIGAGLLKSTDGGASWAQTPFKRLNVTDLSIDPQVPTTLYASGFDGVYQTTDSGASWRLIFDKLVFGEVVPDPKQSSTVYATTSVTVDAFVSKLNAIGTALVYSTYFGGIANDSAASIAADDNGNVYVAGYSSSPDFPVTPNAYQTHTPKPRASTGFVIRLIDVTLPRITSVGIEGKRLLVSGEGFRQGAIIVVNGTDLDTRNDSTTPSVLLISKRGGKQIALGQTVTIRVRNGDGSLSEPFSFTRS